MDNPFSSPTAEANYTPQPTELMAAIRPLYDAKGWMRFLGILNIIMGVLYCITIIGAVVGWVPILIGIKLNRAADNIGRGYELTSLGTVREGTVNLGAVFKIVGILTIVMIVLQVLYFLAIFAFVLVGAAAGGR